MRYCKRQSHNIFIIQPHSHWDNTKWYGGKRKETTIRYVFQHGLLPPPSLELLLSPSLLPLLLLLLVLVLRSVLNRFDSIWDFPFRFVHISCFGSYRGSQFFRSMWNIHVSHNPEICFRLAMMPLGYGAKDDPYSSRYFWLSIRFRLCPDENGIARVWIIFLSLSLSLSHTHTLIPYLRVRITFDVHALCVRFNDI